MYSVSCHKWTNVRSKSLDEIERTHTAVEGIGRGRRYATQQINRAYAVLLAAHFQGYCRDLHSECLDHLVSSLIPTMIQPIVRAEFDLNRQLKAKNAQKGSIGSDFNRLGISFWKEVEAHNLAKSAHIALLAEMNEWRNAIVHEDYDPTKLGGTTTLQLTKVKKWRKACNKLARSFDAVMRQYVQSLIGSSPW